MTKVTKGDHDGLSFPLSDHELALWSGLCTWQDGFADCLSSALASARGQPLEVAGKQVRAKLQGLVVLISFAM